MDSSINTHNSYAKYIPLYQPAIEQDSYRIDTLPLAVRIITIVGITFTGMALTQSILKLSDSFWTRTIIMIVGISTSACLIAWDTIFSRKAADEKAVNDFLDHTKEPSTKACYHITTNLSAAKLLIDKIKNSNGLYDRVLDKVDDKGDRLLYTFSLDFEIFKLLVDAGADVKKTVSLDKTQTIFNLILNDENTNRAKYIIEKKIITKDDFDENQQASLFINYPEIAKELTRNGFNVNSKDKEGFTPLLRSVQSVSKHGLFMNFVSAIITYLDCGADSNITVKVNGEDKNAFQLDEKNLLQNILKKQNPILDQCPPATRIESIACKINAFVQTCHLDKWPLAFLGIMPILFSYDVSITKLGYGVTAVIFAAANSAFNLLVAKPIIKDQYAVNNYLTNSYHPSSATTQIADSPRAIESLLNKIKKPEDLNKLDQEGYGLLNYANVTTFKQLVDAGADLTKVGINPHGDTAFEQAIERENPEFVKYMLETGKVTKDNFTPAEQVNLWMAVRDQETALLLEKFSFDVNVKDEEGYTPLLRVASQNSVFKNNIKTVKSLLACKIDKSITVNIDGEDKTAHQITKKETIKRLLTKKETIKNPLE